jgi:hypothetical protein
MSWEHDPLKRSLPIFWKWARSHGTGLITVRTGYMPSFCNSGREGPYLESNWSMISHFLNSRSVRNEFLIFKPLSLWYFCYSNPRKLK